VQQVPWSAAHEKLVTAYVGGAMPDVFQAGNTWLPELAALDALEPLDDRIARSPALVRETTSRASSTTNGDRRRHLRRAVVRGYPRPLLPRDLLAAAGHPDPPRTWAAWSDAMARVKARAGPERYAILLPSASGNRRSSLALQLGAGLLRDGDRYGDFRSPASTARSTSTWISSGAASRPARGAAVANVYQDFAAGFFALYMSGPWNIGEFRQRLPRHGRPLGHGTLPAPDGGYRGSRWPAARASPCPALAAPGRRLAADRIPLRAGPAGPLYRLTGDLPARRQAWTEAALGA